MPDPSVARFRRIVATAYSYLDARRNEVNDLNVYPVADGDTGDNMALTMRAVLEELDRIESEEGEEADRAELVHAVARAALMGARGNSGVILSQIVRGAAEELATRPGRPDRSGAGRIGASRRPPTPPTRRSATRPRARC